MKMRLTCNGFLTMYCRSMSWSVNLIFFFKQKTAYELRISDWSSDVCSSDLSIDLNAPGARDLALRLCDEADIVVENFRAGALASFGLDYEAVAARNPG